MTSSAQPSSSTIAFADFRTAVDIRVGRIVRAEPFPEARKPAYRLQIDFGADIGVRKSSAQLADRYRAQDLEGRRVLAVVNFPPRQIGPFMSEVLTLGVPDADGHVVLVVPDQDVPLGGRAFLVLRVRLELAYTRSRRRLSARCGREAMLALRTTSMASF